jgi:hypothetical protein
MRTERSYRAIRVSAVALAASAWLVGQVSIMTNHNDNARTGANLNETQLTTSNVNPSLFGKLFSQTVDGSIYGQPLYVPSVTIGGSAHNVVYVATMNDKVYAFDADNNTGANASPLWSQDLATSYGGTPIPIGNLTNGFTTGNIIGNVGIESTPVIDLGTNTIYLLARTQEGSNYVQQLHALDITSGGEVRRTSSDHGIRSRNGRRKCGRYGLIQSAAAKSESRFGPG